MPLMPKLRSQHDAVTYDGPSSDCMGQPEIYFPPLEV